MKDENNGREYKFRDKEIIEFLVRNAIETRATANALKSTFLAYVLSETPDKLDKFDNLLQDQWKKAFAKELDDLHVVDQNISDLLNKELDDFRT